MGAAPAPQSQQQTELGRTDARAEVRTLAGFACTPGAPPPARNSATARSRAEGSVLQRGREAVGPAGPPGGALPLQGSGGPGLGRGTQGKAAQSRLGEAVALSVQRPRLSWSAS